MTFVGGVVVGVDQQLALDEGGNAERRDRLTALGKRVGTNVRKMHLTSFVSTLAKSGGREGANGGERGFSTAGHMPLRANIDVR